MDGRAKLLNKINKINIYRYRNRYNTFSFHIHAYTIGTLGSKELLISREGKGRPLRFREGEFSQQLIGQHFPHTNCISVGQTALTIPSHSITLICTEIGNLHACVSKSTTFLEIITTVENNTLGVEGDEITSKRSPFHVIQRLREMVGFTVVHHHRLGRVVPEDLGLVLETNKELITLLGILQPVVEAFSTNKISGQTIRVRTLQKMRDRGEDRTPWEEESILPYHSDKKPHQHIYINGMCEYDP